MQVGGEELPIAADGTIRAMLEQQRRNLQRRAAGDSRMYLVTCDRCSS